MIFASKSQPWLLAISLALGACSSDGTTPKDAPVPPEMTVVDIEGQKPIKMKEIKTGCSRFFPNGIPPRISDPRFAPRTKQICYRSFSVLHSGLSKTALWSAERLTPESLQAAKGLDRVNDFHPETDLPRDDRAELEHYKGSGYDRGHLAPSADMPTVEAQAESFSLANMIPQTAQLNRGSWERLESSVRQQARKSPVYVVTGPIFIGSKIFVGKNVLVPTQVWKAVLIPKQGAAVFIAGNTVQPRWQVLSVAKFQAGTGIDPFPGMDPALRNTNLALPNLGLPKKP